MGKKKKKKKNKSRSEPDSVSLNAPWNDHASQLAKGGSQTVQVFIDKRSKVHREYIEQEQKTKRLSLALSVVLAAVAGLVFLFAPPGREVLSTVIGAVFLLAAAGLAGYKRLWFKTDIMELDTESVGERTEAEDAS